MARTPIHPGEHLAEELKKLSISAAELARQIDVPVNRVTAIINGQRAITADTSLRLGNWFGTSPEFWLNLQLRSGMASLSAVRSTTIAFTTSRDPTMGGSLCRQRCMDCAGAVAGPCCAKNGSNAGKTDRSLIALGNPACPNKFAKRPAGEREICVQSI